MKNTLSGRGPDAPMTPPDRAGIRPGEETA